jgi:hypothetical protein
METGASPPTNRHRRIGRLVDSIVFAVLSLPFAGITLAASDEALQLFTTGKAAFQRGDFSLALSSFEAAAELDMKGPAIHFNIGVTAYRLGMCGRARSAFLEVTKTPAMAALAHYNLGLTALRCQEPRAAREWFVRVLADAQDEQLVSLATRQLEMLPTPPVPNWIALALVGVGYDDNAALVADPDLFGVSGFADNYLEAQFAATAPLTGSWQFDATVSALKYQKLDEFDQLGALGSARYEFDTGRWNHRAAVQATYSTLDGDGFESKQMLLLQSTRPILASSRLQIQYRFSAIEGLEQYEGIGGQRHEAGVRFDVPWNHWGFGIDYEFSHSDHEDKSLSADRNQLGVTAERQLFASWTIDTTASYRNSRYRLAGDTENRFELGAAVGYSVTEDCRLVGRYAFTHNNADTDELSFERHRVGIAVDVLF